MSGKNSYVCTVCDDTPSGCFSLGAGFKPNRCLYKPAEEDLSSWQEATDYEIVQKTSDNLVMGWPQKITGSARKPGMPQNETVHESLRMFCSGQQLGVPWAAAKPMAEAIIKMKSRTKKTPNCAICEWRKHGELKRISAETESTAYKITSTCEAQGSKECRNYYNTPECKNLFSEKSAPVVEPKSDSVNKWRMLELGEVVQEGDEVLNLHLSKWEPVQTSVGVKVNAHCTTIKFRRAI